MGPVEYLLLDIDTEEMFTAFDTDYQTLNYVSNPRQDNIVLLTVLE
jgi:hypothetical protein